MKLEYPEGATPLDPNELDGLIPTYISTQGELNSAEHANILKAETWLLSKKSPDVLNINFLKQLHKKMFEDVWRWAGVFRRTDKNIGIDARQIQTEIYKLCQDTTYWIEKKTYTWDELGARFHHRLVSIHPFSNGNGRHSRLATDILIETNGQNKFTWGTESLVKVGELRTQYLKALKAADQGDFEKLISFIKS